VATIITAFLLAVSRGTQEKPVDSSTFDWTGAVTPGANPLGDSVAGDAWPLRCPSARL